MIKKIIMLGFIPLTITLQGAFLMKKGEPLKKVDTEVLVQTQPIETVSSETVSSGENTSPNNTQGSGVFYDNASGINDGKDETSTVGQYKQNKRLIFTPRQKYASIGITNIFEYSSIEETSGHGYEFCAIPDAPHGYTAGKIGVASGTASLYNFLNEYYNKAPMNKYLPELERLKEIYRTNGRHIDGQLHNPNSPSYIDGISGICEDWLKTSRSDPLFNKMQDTYISDRRYIPAVTKAEEYNLHLPISLAVFYDTTVLQGATEHIASQIGKFTGNTPEEEIIWLKKFLKISENFIRSKPYWGAGVAIRPQSFNALIDKGYKNKKLWWLDLESFTVLGNGWTKTHTFNYKF